MKKSLTLALALLTMASVAQYNNTYDVNANGDNLAPAFVITTKQAESITVSYASDAATPPRTDYFILTKHDAFGNVMYNHRFDPLNAPKDGFTNVEALIETDDQGVLVAGYYYDTDDRVEQPFLMKVDVNGNFLWIHIYYVNQRPIVSSELNKISLCRVFNDDKENYYIVASGDSDANPGVDVATNVIKVDDSGNMLFSKKYYDTNPTFLSIREYPGDIEFSKKDQMFMITGYRADANLVKEKKMYFFGIDNNGNVVTKFLTLTSKSTPIDEDMIWDPNKNVFAVTFMHYKSSYVQGINSEIGFLTIDASLAVSNTKLLWHNEAIEHNGRSISFCSSGDYVLCAGILDNSITFVNNPAWLKVNNSGDPISPLMRYNIKDDVYFGHHATTYNPDTGDEEYVLVNEHKTDLRMIRTDVNGEVCVYRKFEPLVEKYEPKENTYKYDFREQGDDKRYRVYEKRIDPEYRKCKEGSDSYRTTGIATVGTAESGLQLYPSVVSAGNANLTVVNNSGGDVKMEVRSITGQLVFASNQVTAGKTDVKLNTTGTLSTGIYLVQLYDASGALNSTTKILITE